MAYNNNNVQVPFATAVHVEKQFIYGQAFSFQVELIASSIGMTNVGSMLGSVSADHSAYWAGFTVTADGLPVDFTATSLSGTDWTRSFVPNPVPEPQTYALLLVGLAVLARRAKPRN